MGEFDDEAKKMAAEAAAKNGASTQRQAEQNQVAGRPAAVPEMRQGWSFLTSQSIASNRLPPLLSVTTRFGPATPAHKTEC
jgi:hypothetical protein